MGNKIKPINTNYSNLIGKGVVIHTSEPIKTHFSTGTKTLYGHLQSDTNHLIQVEIGHVSTTKTDMSQVHIISKDIIKSIKQEWLETVVKGNKEWYKPTDAWIPVRDEKP